MVFEIICRSYTTPPEICVKEIKDLTGNSPLNKHPTKNEKSQENNNFISILLLTIGIIAAFLLFVLLIKCKIFTRTTIPNDISLNINSAVSRYFAFQDKNDQEKMIEVSA
jgi:hypothetical protein